jgi:hypothetical protein
MESLIGIAALAIAAAIFVTKRTKTPAPEEELRELDPFSLSPESLLETLAQLRPDLSDKDRMQWARGAAIALFTAQAREITDTTALVRELVCLRALPPSALPRE